MSAVIFTYDGIPSFAKALKEAAPEHLIRATGRALFKMGQSDIAKMKSEQLQGGSLNIKSKKFLNSFRFKASDSRQVASIEQLQLQEYTGAKPFKIFQDGGDIAPKRSKLLTILAPGGRTAAGARKYTQKELKAMIDSKQAIIIQTKAGPAIILNPNYTTKGGKAKTRNAYTIIAWLKPQVHEQKCIDFYANFENNSAQHQQILDAAAQEAIDKTLNDEEHE
jgi:hypothetical protein